MKTLSTTVLALLALPPFSQAKKPEVTPVNVLVAKVASGTGERELTLPGELLAAHDTQVRARADGYISRYLVDIGDKVKAGQLLAVIEAPDLEKRLDQAKATRDNAASKLRIAQGNAKRAHGIRLKGAVSPEELDQRDALLAQAEAAAGEAAAEVARYEELHRFLRVTAPFDGVIAERNVDIGRLVSPGPGTGSGLFRVTDNTTLRAYVGVPQSYIAGLHSGAKAELLLSEYPGRTFPGVVSRVSGAIDPASRTLVAEVRIPNASGTLIPGMFGRLRLKLSASESNSKIIPANALMLGAAGPRVALVDKDSVVHLRKVVLGHDNGATVEIAEGLKAGDTVVMNPGDLIVDGCKVAVVTPENDTAKTASKE